MPSRGFIREQTASYIESQLKENNSEQQKVALQNLCKLYRSGYRLQNPYRFKIVIIGLLYSLSAKVRRWSLNALGLIGDKTDIEAVINATARNSSDPDILSAGIAALFSMDRNADRMGGLLRLHQLPLEGATLLAAAQSVKQFQKDLAAHPVNIDRALPVELRMATLLIGLDKAPRNLLHATHTNDRMIGELNGHNDPIVAQYSVWAICENQTLGLPNLKLDLRHLADQPPNVRGWLYRLLVSDADTASRHREYLESGSTDTSPEAREGLAFGIRQIFFEGIERVVFDWFPNEESEVIRNALIEHMACNAENYPEYERAVIDTYERAPPQSLARARLEAASEGRALYGKLRKISIKDEHGSLFGTFREEPGGNVTHQTFNIKDSQIGSLSGSGAAVGGTVHFKNNEEALAALAATVPTLIALLGAAHIAEADKKEGIQIAESAAAKPSKGTLKKLLGWMRALQTAGGVAAELSRDFSQTFDQLQSIFHHLS